MNPGTPPGELEPIETASTDELQALQLERLRWSLRHAYENVPYYRKMFDVAAVHPDDVKDLADLAQFPFTTKAVAARQLPVRHVRGAARAGRPRPRLVRHHRPPDRRRLHRARTSTPGPTVMARSIRAAGGRPGHIVHVAYGYGLFTGGLGAHYGAERLGCTVVPVSGGMTERQVTLIRDFEPGRHHGHPVVHARDPRRDGAPGPRPGPLLAEVRHLRRRAVDERDARRDRGPGRHRRDRHLRPVRGDGPRRRPGVRRDQGRPARLGGPLLPRGHRPGHRPGAARRRARASWSSPR